MISWLVIGQGLVAAGQKPLATPCCNAITPIDAADRPIGAGLSSHGIKGVRGLLSGWQRIFHGRRWRHLHKLLLLQEASAG